MSGELIQEPAEAGSFSALGYCRKAVTADRFGKKEMTVKYKRKERL